MQNGTLIDEIAGSAGIPHNKAEQAAKAAVQGFLGARQAKELAIVPRRPPPDGKAVDMALAARPSSAQEIVPFIAKEADIPIAAARIALSIVARSFGAVAAEADAPSGS